MSVSQLILASSSASRKSLLETLKMPFQCQSPNIDESQHPGESIQEMVLRLSIEKAQAIAARNPGCVVIGSDQSAINLADPHTFLGKPKTRQRALEQLRASNGQTLIFYTGLCVIDPHRTEPLKHLAETHLKMRDLSPVQLALYVDKEDVLNCAGSFRSEGLGVALFEQLTESEPGALMGLPLISLVNFLSESGWDPLSP